MILKEIENIKNVNDQLKNSKILKKIFVPNKIMNIVITKNE